MVIGVMAVAAVVGVSGSPAWAGCETATRLTDGELRQAEARLVELIAAERSAAGLGSFAGQGRVAEVGRGHAARMAADGRIYHNDAYFSMHDELGASMLGENVGVGCDADQLHRAFMDSPAHKANILKAGFTHVGLGAATDATGRLYVVEGFATIPAPAAKTSAPAPAPATTAPARTTAPAPAPHVTAAPPAPPTAAPVSAPAPAEPRTVGAGASEFSPVEPPVDPRDAIDSAAHAEAPRVGAVAALMCAAGILALTTRRRDARPAPAPIPAARLVQRGPSTSTTAGLAGLRAGSQTPASAREPDARLAQIWPERAIKASASARR